MIRGVLWTLGWLAACAPSAGARVASAPSVCSDLAVQLRRSPALVAKDMRLPHQWLKPWIVLAKAHRVKVAAVSRQIDSRWHTAIGGAAPTRIETLRGTALVRVSKQGVDRAGYCSRALFFKRKPGGALEMLHLPPLNLGPCAAEWGGLATVLGIPAYIEFDSFGFGRSVSVLRVAPWQGGEWGRPCPVTMRFIFRAGDVRQLYCTAERSVCTAARKVAPELGQRYQHYILNGVNAVTNRTASPRIQFRSALKARAWSMIVRAQHIATTRALTAVRGAPPPWLRHLRLDHVQYFPLRLNGALYLGAIGPVAFGARMLFGVYQVPRESSHRLIPLAVFKMRWQRIGEKWIRVQGLHGAPNA